MRGIFASPWSIYVVVRKLQYICMYAAQAVIDGIIRITGRRVILERASVTSFRCYFLAALPAYISIRISTVLNYIITGTNGVLLKGEAEETFHCHSSRRIAIIYRDNDDDNRHDMSTRFTGIKLGPPIEVFALQKAFVDDTHENKVNLTIGAYRTSEGKPWVLPVVKKVERSLATDDLQNHEYLPVLGLDAFSEAATSMLLGANSPVIAQGRAFSIQSLSGTGALRVTAEFLSRVLQYDTFYYSKPSWENHRLVFTNGGFKHACEYTYWDEKTRSIDLEGMLDDLRNAPENAVIILHACAHNPTGCDPTPEQWAKIADVIEEKRLFPLFDSAYQGFASGDLDKDAYAVRMFAERGIELICTQSFAKNFGLYNERVGNIVFVLNDTKELVQAKSQLTLIVRGMYSNPPNHGARIVATVLRNSEFFEEWREHIRTMSGRIKQMRVGLHHRLLKLGTPGVWDHIVQQIGMFSYTGLTERQVQHLRDNYHIYTLRSGRINMCGLNESNLDYVANAIHETVMLLPETRADCIC